MYLSSHSSKITNPEHISHNKQVKDPDSNSVNDLLMKNTIPVTLYDDLFTFPDTDKNSNSGDLLKMITKKTIMLILLNYRTK